MPESKSLEKACPLCGGANNCAMANGKPAASCWCQSAQLNPEALAAIPDQAQGKYCICAACGAITPEAGREQ